MNYTRSRIAWTSVLFTVALFWRRCCMVNRQEKFENESVWPASFQCSFWLVLWNFLLCDFAVFDVFSSTLTRWQYASANLISFQKNWEKARRKYPIIVSKESGSCCKRHLEILLQSWVFPLLPVFVETVQKKFNHPPLPPQWIPWHNCILRWWIKFSFGKGGGGVNIFSAILVCRLIC